MKIKGLKEKLNHREDNSKMADTKACRYCIHFKGYSLLSKNEPECTKHNFNTYRWETCDDSENGLRDKVLVYGYDDDEDTDNQ